MDTQRPGHRTPCPVPKRQRLPEPRLQLHPELLFHLGRVQLPITYSSNILKATEILVSVGEEYTQKFVDPAKSEIEKMRNTFLLPDLTLKPVVYTKVTSNYALLNMRYLVDARHRRDANSWLYWHMLNRLRPHTDITIGSDTMNVTIFKGDTEPAAPSSSGITTVSTGDGNTPPDNPPIA